MRPFKAMTTVNSTDAAAADPRIDVLRAKIHCGQDDRFSVDYHDPDKRSIGNALLVTLTDGTVLPEVEIEYPVGHKRRRAEGTPLLLQKFKRHISLHFDEAHQQKLVTSRIVLAHHNLLVTFLSGFWTLFWTRTHCRGCQLTSLQTFL
jgi:2-methylcitrate dehydratase